VLGGGVDVPEKYIGFARVLLALITALIVLLLVALIWV
jgi:hypothetical protein